MKLTRITYYKEDILMGSGGMEIGSLEGVI
jgi:hypothetical protein